MSGRYRKLEARYMVGRAPVVVLVAGLVLLLLTQLSTPLLPPAVIGLLEQAFVIRGTGAVILLNDYLALYTVLFFGGAAPMLGVLVTPREEHQLDLLLAKPVPPSVFLQARAVPILVSTGVVGVLLSLACGLAMAPYVGPGADGTVLGAIGAGLVVTGFVLVLLLLANVVFVRLNDSFGALLIGFMCWMLPLLPASVFLYRPDLFVDRPALASALVAPANLLWHDGQMVWVGVMVWGVVSLWGWASMRIGGWWLRSA